MMKKTKFASTRNLTIWYVENLRLKKALEWENCVATSNLFLEKNCRVCDKILGRPS
ncbi:unnamed protein product [Arabidopsis halleri]